MKTGEKKGIFHDMMEEIGKRLDLKIVWQEELGWGSVAEAVNGKRVDMSCAGYWPNAGRIKNLRLASPQLYSPLYIYMRVADDRLFHTPDELNDPRYAVSLIDGSAESRIAAARFPRSKVIALPELGTSAESVQNLLTKKVDFLILDSASAASYAHANPGKIKRPFPETPMALFPTVMLLPIEDAAFGVMIDAALLDIERDGTLDVILKKYHSTSLFLRNPQPQTR